MSLSKTCRRIAGVGVALALTVPTVAATAPTAVAEEYDGKTVLSVGHTDAMSVHFQNNELFLQVNDDTVSPSVDRDPADVLFQVLPHAEIPIPAGDTWRFLGAAGDPMWMLPLVQDHSLLWPGWSTESLQRGQFEDNRLSMSLVDVDGPGEVILWSVSSFGEPQVRYSTRTGLPERLDVLVPSHVHSYWAFTAEGSYTLTWQVDGTLSNGTRVSTGQVEYHWHVGELPDDGGGGDPDPPPPGDGDIDLSGRLVLDEGHVDVFSVHLGSSDALDLQVKDDTRLHADSHVFRDPDDVAFHAVPESKVVLGDWASDPVWDRLGDPGDTLWLLPDTDKPGLLFPGWSTETIQNGQLRDDEITLSLVDFTGPGDLVLLSIDDFGSPTYRWDTKGSLPQDIQTRSRTHAHANWYFTEPGVYGLSVRAEAALPDGTAVVSQPEQFVFVVDEWPDDGGGDPAPPPKDSQVITATIDADAGGLILSIDPNDRNVDLPPARLDSSASRWSTEGGLRPVTVTDTRTANPGWTASGRVGAFSSSGGDRFGGAHLGWKPSVTSNSSGQRVDVGSNVRGKLDGGPGLATSQTLASTAAGAGRGTAVLSARLRLDLQTSIPSGRYTAHITFTAI